MAAHTVHVHQEALVPEDWVRSREHFHSALFRSDFNNLWDPSWGKGIRPHLHPQRAGRSCKMDRWRAMSLPWGQVSREDRNRIWKKLRRVCANERGRVKQWAEKGESRVRDSCQEAGYGSKSRQVKSTQLVETGRCESDSLFDTSLVNQGNNRAGISYLPFNTITYTVKVTEN